MNTPATKMKVEIWSDVMCPFCYIGKRKFENALSEFENASDIEIEWKAFQLSPDMKTNPDKNIHEYLAEHKDISVEQARGFNDRITLSAKHLGLIYDFDKAIPANSFKAHRFSHLAKQHGLQDAAEERLFKAYFTDGLNFDDIPTLVELGVEIGLDAAEVKTALEGDAFTEDVRQDIYEAYQLGVRGVPFFVFDRKMAVSGAQESEIFLETLQRSFADWRKKNPKPALEMIEGQVCTPDGKCD